MLRANGTPNEAPVEIVLYQDAWPSLFVAERHLLEKVLAPWLCASIEHIGSSAVPGLAAKPIIDIMAPVCNLDDARPAIEVAAQHGYMYYPYNAEVMHWFCKPSPAHRTHHLHLVPYGSKLWNERIAFRQALRGSKSLAEEYARLKYKLAAVFQTDREGFTQAKEPFVRRVLFECQAAPSKSSSVNQPVMPVITPIAPWTKTMPSAA
jgi:GrpB-like predicted nucleotidyltransferase (UPF0157 family)